MYLSKDTPNKLSNVDETKSVSCLDLVIKQSSSWASQIGLAISQLQKQQDFLRCPLSVGSSILRYSTLLIKPDTPCSLSLLKAVWKDIHGTKS